MHESELKAKLSEIGFYFRVKYRAKGEINIEKEGNHKDITIELLRELYKNSTEKTVLSEEKYYNHGFYTIQIRKNDIINACLRSLLIFHPCKQSNLDRSIYTQITGKKFEFNEKDNRFYFEKTLTK